jgi:predicted enzyme related to lactoylglutathione lyase
MTTMTAHAHGTFCWPELATTDATAAKKFYGALFGWEHRDNDMGSNGLYTIFTLGDREVAAGYSQLLQQHLVGVPPHWAAYVAVDDADTAAAKAESLGGKVLQPAFDVMDVGRMAVITDPQGAAFSVWQARKHPGVRVLGEPGSLGWTQLNAASPERAKPFYSSLFSWKYRDDPMPWGGFYTSWMRADGAMAGGMLAMPPEANAPSHWLSYFVATDVDRSHAQATALGAKTFVTPSDLPGGGRFSVLADPQGAAFGLMTSMPE